METKTLEFHFDYLSPYSYLAWNRLPPMLEGRDVELKPRPVLLAGLLDHWGNRGPAEIPAKRDWMIRDVLRLAARDDIPLAFPDPHPFNPLGALRASLPRVCGDERQNEVIDAIYGAVWGEGRDVSDPDVLQDALGGVVDDPGALYEKTRNPEVKKALAEQTARAAERGVFGVPTMIVDGELFWGNDRLEFVRRVLDGDDELDRDAYREAKEVEQLQR